MSNINQETGVYGSSSISASTIFVENKAPIGGAVYTANLPVVIDDCSFDRNIANEGGAVASLSNGKFVIF